MKNGGGGGGGFGALTGTSAANALLPTTAATTAASPRADLNIVKSPSLVPLTTLVRHNQYCRGAFTREALTSYRACALFWQARAFAAPCRGEILKALKWNSAD